MEFYDAPEARRRTTRFNSKEDSRGGFRNQMEDLLFLTEGGLTRFILAASARRNSSSRRFHVSLSLIEESKNRIRTNDFLDSCSGFPIIQVPDVQDVYTPLESDVIVQLYEYREHLERLLESIPTMFQSNRTDHSAFCAAVKAAFRAMKSTGGKLLIFQSGKLSFLLLALDPFLLEKLMAEAIVQQEKRRNTNYYNLQTRF
ncbi:hypothetical protein ACS0TY_000784 [Phlomoides rotata]